MAVILNGATGGIQLTSASGGTMSVNPPATATSYVSTLPAATGTLLNSASSLPAANLTGTVADARISALTASKLTGALPAISGASLTGIASGGVTLLDTIATTSGTTVASSTLNLSTYKTLQVFIYNVGNTTSGGVLRWAETSGTALQISGTTGGAGKSSNGVITHNLATGVSHIGRSYDVPDGTTTLNYNGSSGIGINTEIDTATTSISFNFSGGETFNGGSILIYGLK